MINKYCALISRSTVMNSITSRPDKILFKCKNNTKNNCGFLQELLLILDSEPPLYELHSINSKHLEECVLSPEELNYHHVVKKIDENMIIIERIVEELHTTEYNVRPKRVLELLAMELGESPDFIY